MSPILSYNGYNFLGRGCASYRTSVAPDPPAPAKPGRYLRTWTVTVDFSGCQQEDLYARVRELRTAVARPEAELIVQHASGFTEFAGRACFTGDDLPAAISAYTGSITLTFQTWAPIPAGGGGAASAAGGAIISNLDGSNPCSIVNLGKISHSVDTDRPDPRKPNRTRTTETVDLSGTTVWADPALDEAERRAFLLEQAKKICDAILKKEVLITVPGTSYEEVFQISRLTCEPDDKCTSLKFSMSGRREKWPDSAGFANLEFTESASEPCGSEPATTTVAGTIDAEDGPTADAALADLLASYIGRGLLLKGRNVEDRYLQGEDSDVAGEPDWCGLSFSLTFCQPDAVTSFTHSITVSEDKVAGGCTRNCSGTVTASDEAAARAQAALLRGAPGVAKSCEETLNYESDCDTGATRFVSLDFSFVDCCEGDGSITIEYSCTRSSTKGGDSTVRISGSITAGDEVTALAQLDALKATNPLLGGLTPRSAQSTANKTASPTTETFTSLTFDCEYVVPAAAGGGTFTDSAREGAGNGRTRTISGTVTAPDEVTAIAVAMSCLPADACIRERGMDREICKTGDGAADAETVRWSFSWTIQEPAEFTSVNYRDRTSFDAAAVTCTRTLAGSISAPTLADAQACLQLLHDNLAADAIAISGQDEEAEYVGDKGSECFVKLGFTINAVQDASGKAGTDVLKAELCVERKGQINHCCFDEIPLSIPVVQRDWGFNVGEVTVTGSICALNPETAKAWAQSKRPYATNFDGALGCETPPVEAEKPKYAPFSNSNVQYWEFRFRYHARYETDLYGVWPAGYNTP